MGQWDNAYYTLLRYGFTDKTGRNIQADQGTNIDNRQLGITCSNLQTFGAMSYDMFYATYFNELTLIELEVTHIDYDDSYGVHHTYDIDEIAFSKQANDPYGDYVLKYQNQEVTRIPFAGTTAPLGITRVEGIELHLENYVSFNLVCYEYQIPGGDLVKCAVLSCSDNISDYMKENYPPCAAFEYEYAVSDSIDLFSAIFDAQLKGQYWDPEGNAGKPTGAGGGQGDYRRPDQEIGIPGLPAISAVDTGFVGIYNVTAAEVQDLAADLWTTNFFDSIIKNFRSPLDNIISLSIVPFDGFTGELAQIVVGNFESHAAGLKLATTFYELDCGILDINEYYGTYADYTLTKIQLYLPLCGVISINPDDCTSGKIRVVYHFDVFSGDVIAFVQTITKGAWHVLYTADGNIKAELPINGQNYLSVYTNAAKSVLGAMTANPVQFANNAINAVESIKPEYNRAGNISGTSGLMAVQYPYLIFSTPQMAVPDNFKALKGYISNLKTKIGDATGYIQCSTDNVDMTGFVNATNDEIEMIKSLLADGIYIE